MLLRIIGIPLLSIFLGIRLFATMGPLLGAFLVDIATLESPEFKRCLTLLGFGLGVAIVFGLALRFISMFYQKINKSKIWKGLQIFVLLYILLNLIIKLNEMFDPFNLS